MIKYFFLLALLSSLLFIPMITDQGIRWTWDYFYTMPNQYPYTSVYAYNLWSPLGFLVSDKENWLSIIEYRYVGIILFWLIAGFIILSLVKAKKKTPMMLVFAAMLLWFDFAFFPTRIHSRYLIYSLGFFAPFATKLPKQAAALTFLVMANLLLPNTSTTLASLVAWLNNQWVIVGFTSLTFILFANLLHKYYLIMSGHEAI